MAYASYNIATAGDVRDAIADFASQMGWVVTDTGNSTYRIKRPDDPNAVEFALLRYTSSHLIDRLISVGADREVNNITAVTDIGPYSESSSAPTYGGGASVVRVHGELGDAPWIFASVECAGGSFRNIAFGYLSKVGEYEGGEYYTTSTRAFQPATGGGGWNGESNINRGYRIGYFNNPRNACALFGAMLGDGLLSHIPERGAIRINGTWYPYKGPASTSPSSTFLVIGAPPTFAPIKAPGVGGNAFSGHAPMIPINHYWGNTTLGTSGFWVPIGHPSGIRSVDMTNFFPLQQVTLADNSVWRIYPSTRKGSMTQSDDEETSGPHGYAVRESFG